MKRHLAAAILTLAAVPAAADFRFTPTQLQLFLPAPAWSVTLPREDWFLAQDRVKPGDVAAYAVASSPARGVNLSVLIQRSNDCETAPGCRALWKKNAAEGLAKATAMREYDRNGFSVIEFQLDKPEGADVVQLNVWGHAYRDGHWIDVHLSKVGKTRPDSRDLVSVLDAIAIAPKVLDGQQRVYPVPGYKSYAFDVPPTWRDAMGGDQLPTINFKPTKGEGFEVLVTLIPPKTPGAPAPTREEVQGHVKRAIEGALTSSVEKKIEPREVKGKDTWGYAFGATDRAPGDGFKFMRQGFVVTGNQMLFYTVLFRPGEERNADAAAQMALSARPAP